MTLYQRRVNSCSRPLEKGKFPCLCSGTGVRKIQVQRTRPPLILLIIALIWSVYWIPGVSIDSINMIKDAVLLLFVLQHPLNYLTARQSIASLAVTRVPSYAAWLVALLAFSFPTIIISPDFNANIVSYLRLVVVLPLFLNAAYIFKRNPAIIEPTFKLMTVPVLVSVVLVFLGYLGIYTVDPPAVFVRSFGSAGYLMGLSYRSGGLAHSIAYISPTLAYFSATAERNVMRCFWYVSLLLSLFVCSLLLNRAGFLATLVATLMVVFVVSRGKGSFGLGVQIFILSLGAYYLSDLLIGTLLYHGPEQAFLNTQDFSTGRFERWKSAYDVFEDISIFGLGYSQLEGAMEYSTSAYHNLYIIQILSAGAIGGSIMIAFMWKIVILCKEYFIHVFRERERSFLVVPSVNLFVHIFLSFVESGAMFFTVYLGISFWFSLACLTLISPKRSRATTPQTSKESMHE